MECPVCKSRGHIDVDTHADGFAANLQECGNCGAVWTNKGMRTIVLHGSHLQAACNA